MIRKISSAIESFGLTIDLVECEPEQTVYAIKVLK
jgi:hypothetical protein